ncbi:Rieske (2Fe-2S) protein [Embleya sp. NPDC127516]|uniref:Rieske (2Fe-2S) protein n=1 Tax=Embleya sp. NPDC127516 TaxID=3363990 RepID=UPI0037FE301C
MSPFRRERPPVCLGPLASLPEDVPTRVATSPPVAILRHGDTVHVFEDRCPHAGAILSRGTLTNEHLTCPAHKATFELATGRSTGQLPCRPLHTYTSWLQDGILYHSPTPRPTRKAQKFPCPNPTPPLDSP